MNFSDFHQQRIEAYRKENGSVRFPLRSKTVETQ